MLERIAPVLFCAITLAALSACDGDTSPAGSGAGGSTSGPALGAFHKSACKKESQTASAASPLSGAESASYEGLQCVRWSPIDGGFSVFLRNFDGACGAEWEGRVTALASATELRVVNPKCLLAKCGTCMYDFTFDVKMAAKAGGDAFDLVLDPCPGQQDAKTVSVTLPLATEPSGELCRYASASALGWQAMSLGTCGKAYMPCREAGMSGMCPPADGGASCDDGLTCAAGASADARVCHATCAKDVDCEPAGLMACDAGLCRPSKTF